MLWWGDRTYVVRHMVYPGVFSFHVSKVGQREPIPYDIHFESTCHRVSSRVRTAKGPQSMKSSSTPVRIGVEHGVGAGVRNESELEWNVDESSSTEQGFAPNIRLGKWPHRP